MACLAWHVPGLILFSLVAMPIISRTHAVPPQPPVDCNHTGCTLSNAYGLWGDRKECLASAVFYPTTEQDILSAVANATRNNQKVKVVTGYAHTIPKLSCPASPPENSVLISTAKHNSNIQIDQHSLIVTADSGVGLRKLIDRVEEAGLSLVPSPYWEGVSIGGLISTGSHGSSWWGQGGAVHDHVVGLSLVVPARPSDGYAKVLRINRSDPIFNAARVSLGLLGVISKVSLSLDPGFKRRITFSFQNDTHLEEAFVNHAQEHEFADITWYPSQRQIVYRIDDRVPLNSSGDGMNDFLGFQSTSILVSSGVRSAEKLLESARNVKGKCAMAASELAFKKLVANGLKNKLTFNGYPVVGRQGRMQTSGSCSHSPASSITSSCAWDPRIKGLKFYETTAIFPASEFGNFVKDVKKLIDLNPENFCGLDIYNGFLIRFIKASGAYIGQPEDSVVVDFNYYRADEASTPRLNQDVWEEVEQMAFFKHGAKPHWAKNRNVAFLGVQNKYPNFSRFLEAKTKLDPKGMFSSQWSDEILFGKASAKVDGCAMDGQCICSEDKHCNPSKQYFCKPGLIYRGARVCRYQSSTMTS